MPSDIDGEKKTIDIDDKGPGAEVIFPEEKQAEEKESNETTRRGNRKTRKSSLHVPIS